MTRTTRAIPEFSTVCTTPHGKAIAIRAMVPTDKDAVLAFHRRIPADDRMFFRKDVTSAQLVNSWAENLDYNRVLPLLAIVDDKVIADATLHRDSTAVPRHVAELRIVIDPAHRNQGLGRFLLKMLVQIAEKDDPELEEIHFELVADTEEAARHAARAVGFVEAHPFSEHVGYYGGRPHNLTLMVLRVRETRPEHTDDPAEHMF